MELRPDMEEWGFAAGDEVELRPSKRHGKTHRLWPKATWVDDHDEV